MSPYAHSPLPRRFRTPAGILAFLAFAPLAQAQVNMEINKQLWKQKFGVLDAQMAEQAPYSGWLSQDADGDGVNNRAEFLAGTNPFKKLPGEPHFRAPAVLADTNNLSLTFPSVAGKFYAAEGNSSLMGAWTRGPLPGVTGDGTPKTMVVPKSAATFFRVAVSDQATQGDQVSDWAKNTLGLSPASSISAQTSYDHQTLEAELQDQSVVSIEAYDTDAVQPTNDSAPADNTGVIRIQRSGFLLPGEITVPISTSGTAVAGVDFTSLPGSVVFPAGVNALDIVIKPLHNPARSSGATVFVSAGPPGSGSASGNYTLGSPTSAGVTIYPAANPVGTGLTANYYPGASSTYSNPLNFGGVAGTYSYIKSTTTTGTATINYTGTPSVPFTVGRQVTLQFTSSTLNTSPYNTPLVYSVMAPVTASSFTVSITGAAVPSNSSGTPAVVIGGFSAPLTRLDPVVDFTWNNDSPDPSIPADYFSCRWTGQILPQYSQEYFFVTKANAGSKLWINNQLVVDQWGSTSEKTGGITLQKDVLYDITMESYETTGTSEVHLSWYSEDQAKQIIPTGRLFPTTSGKPAITSPTSASTILGAGTPFSMNVTSSNGGVVSASGLPSWLTLSGGILSGTPTAAGIYQFTLTTSNAAGSGSVVMTLEVLAPGGMLTRELWTSGVTGSSLAGVPWTSPPDSSDTITVAEDNTTTYDINTGERLRGYFTAPVSGNYYFWVSASNTAELWISNDSEPVNKVLRASVAGPAGTAPKTWASQPGQKSKWLSLVAGKRYYFEILHNTGSSGGSNHLSAAWFLDPTGSTSSPIAAGCPPATATTGGIIPGHVLSPWDNPPTISVPGSLYVTGLQGVAGLTGITANGGAFLRVNGSTAVVQLNYSGLSSGVTARKIYNSSGAVIFDITGQDRNYPALKTSDGGYTWNMQPADLADLNAGGVYVVVSTVNHPTGEITGTFGKTAGSQFPPAAPSYPSWPDLHASSDAENSRFLTQATFGPGPADMAYVKANGYRPWIENQFTLPSTKNIPHILSNLSNDPQNPYGSTLMFNSWWKNSITAPDQLRQRAAFALSQILVVSDVGPLNNNGRVLADYYDTLLDSCFGNFRDILKQVTLSPAMGVYLDMRANSLGNIQTGQIPNENYAREILQLFSSGLYRVWPDGTFVLDSSGRAVPTYDQNVITGFARVFTGWNWGQPLLGTGRLPTSFSPSTNYLDPMVLVPTKHELGSKIQLDNVVIPPATNTDSATTAVDPNPISIQTTDPVNGQGFPVTTSISNQYDLNGLKDLEAALDNIAGNSAVGPYICRQLIQRLVTSHPKPEYVHRVVRAFNGERNVDGVATGVRGDMKEVFRAILLDYEARSPIAAADPKFGKQREPLLRVTGPARSFPSATFPGSTYAQNGLQAITVTTPTPHRLINGESVRLSNFVDTGSSTTSLPSSQAYTIANVTTNSFTVNNNATSSNSYSTSGSNATVTTPSNFGLAAGDQVYLKFSTGGLSGGSFDGIYTVAGATSTTFTVPLGSSPATTSGTTLIPRTTGGYNVSGSAGSQTILLQTSGNHNLAAGESVQIKFVVTNSPLAAQSGVYTVTSVAGPNSFRVTVPTTITNGSQGTSGMVAFPLKASQWTRTGTVTVDPSAWSMGKSDSTLNQTPLNSTTVFNFFYPDYQYPGEMAQAGMTTPEFQLTNDSNTMVLTNSITQGTLTNNNSNYGGYVSFLGSNSIMLDLAPYMTPTQTSNAGIPTLVNDLGVLLTGGSLTSATKTTIANYVIANHTYTTPTATQMRDRVRAIVHLIVTSAEYAIQK